MSTHQDHFIVVHISPSNAGHIHDPVTTLHYSCLLYADKGISADSGLGLILLTESAPELCQVAFFSYHQQTK